MLAYTFYENDGRVIRYAEALAERSVATRFRYDSLDIAKQLDFE